MKIIITENQQIRLRKIMSELLEREFANTNIICEIKVLDIDEEEEDYKNGLRYDIYVFLNDKFVRTGGIHGFTVSTKRKINKLLSNWFGLTGDEYYISIMVKDC